ncbi:MAG: Holliday junction branch migration protein RuvA [Rickettsiales bacterium]|jgi:Holliday junction DNA helicase RuvA|nr:Holliday junction branch migration protein RuvA [Rickettsiales bacterium]
MIGKLTGFIDVVESDYVILDVGGVGYLVYCSGKTLDFIQNKKEKISLLIETVVKDDSITLFGFVDNFEKECFNTLCKVSGVGNKMAMKILTSATGEEVISGIVDKDKTVFTRASGVGEKVALRIITELSNCQLAKSYGGITLGKFIDNNNELISNKNLIVDAIQALESLGYLKSTVQPIVIKVLKEKPYLQLESIITEVLKMLNRF